MNARLRASSFAASVLVALALTGCVAATPPTEKSTGAALERPNVSGAPDFFNDRPVVPSCGNEKSDPTSVISEKALDCFNAAASTQGAELVVTRRTTEGDPIVYYYLVAPGVDGVDIFVDTTADKFGPRGWSRDSCPEPQLDARGDCSA